MDYEQSREALNQTISASKLAISDYLGVKCNKITHLGVCVCPSWPILLPFELLPAYNDVFSRQSVTKRYIEPELPLFPLG